MHYLLQMEIFCLRNYTLLVQHSTVQKATLLQLKKLSLRYSLRALFLMHNSDV